MRVRVRVRVKVRVRVRVSPAALPTWWAESLPLGLVFGLGLG